MRCNYTVSYVRKTAPKTVQILKEVDLYIQGDAATPNQGRIALTDNDDEMAIMFTSGSKDNKPFVQYGIESTNMNLTACGGSTTYTASDMYVI